MLSQNYVRNEPDCCVFLVVRAAMLYSFSKTTFYIAYFPPSLLAELAFLPANERTKVQSDSPSAPTSFSSTRKIFRHAASHPRVARDLCHVAVGRLRASLRLAVQYVFFGKTLFEVSVPCLTCACSHVIAYRDRFPGASNPF